MKKIVFQFVGEEVQNSLFFDDDEDAKITFQNFIEDGYATWLSEDAKNAAGEKFDIAYNKRLIKFVALVDVADKTDEKFPEKKLLIEMLDDANDLLNKKDEQIEQLNKTIDNAGNKIMFLKNLLSDLKRCAVECRPYLRDSGLQWVGNGRIYNLIQKLAGVRF